MSYGHGSLNFIVLLSCWCYRETEFNKRLQNGILLWFVILRKRKEKAPASKKQLFLLCASHWQRKYLI